MTAGPDLVVLIGPAGAGKSTYAASRWQPHQVHSLDGLRALVADDECDQDATADAVAILTAILGTHLGESPTKPSCAGRSRPQKGCGSGRT